MVTKNTKEWCEKFKSDMDSPLMLGLHVAGISWQALHGNKHTVKDLKKADEQYIQRVYKFLDDAEQHIKLSKLLIMSVFIAINTELEINAIRSLFIHGLISDEGREIIDFSKPTTQVGEYLKRNRFSKENGLECNHLSYGGVTYEAGLGWMNEYFRVKKSSEVG